MPVTRPASGRTVLIQRDHIVTGTAAELTNVLANHHTARTLVSHGRPVPTPDGRFQLAIRVTERVPRRPSRRVDSVGDYTRTRTRRAPRPGRQVAVITTVALLLAGLGFLLHELVLLIAAYWPWLAAVALVLTLAGTRLSRSGTAHCPGCPR